LLKVLSETPKARMYISNYTANEELKNKIKTQELVDIFKENKIQYFIDDNLRWSTSAKLYPYYEKNSELAKENFLHRCFLVNCNQLCEGKLYRCAVSVYIERNLKNFNENVLSSVPLEQKNSSTTVAKFEFEKDEIVDIMQDLPKNVTKKLILFYSKPYFEMCSWCDFTGCKGPIMPAEQLSPIL
jgi:hypothetical protein